MGPGYRRLLRGVLVGVIGYLVASNLALNLVVPGLINQRPDRVELEFTFAWMIVPCWVQVHGLHLHGTGREDRWSVEVPWASGFIDPTALFARTFRAHRLRTSGGAFRYRLRDDPEPERPRDPQGPWTIELYGIGAMLDEVEVIGHLLTGPAAIDGHLVLAKAIELDLQLGLQAGSLRRGERAVASAMVGTVELSLHDIVRLQPLGADDLEKVRAHLDLVLQADDLSVLEGYLEKTPWLSLEGSAVVDVDLTLEQGRLAIGSRATTATRDVELGFRAYRIAGDGDLALAVEEGGGGASKTTARAVYRRFSIREGEAPPLVQGQGFSVHLSAGSVELAKPFDQVDVAIDLPASELVNLAGLTSMLPDGSGVEVSGGGGVVHGHLGASSSNGHAAGELFLRVTDVGLRLDALQMIGNAAAHVVLAAGDLDHGVYPFAGSTVDIDGFGFADDPDRTWWAHVQLDEGVATVGADPYATGAFSLSAASSGPLLTLVLHQARVTGMPAWTQALFEVEDLRGVGRLELRKRALLLRGLTLEGGSAELQLDLLREGNAQRGVLFARLGPLSMGVGFRARELALHPLGARSWFAAHRLD